MLRGFYLTLLIGPTVPVPAPQPVIDALTGVQVTTSAGQASGFQLTFAMSKKSPLNTQMLPVGAFDPFGNFYSLDLAYNFYYSKGGGHVYNNGSNQVNPTVPPEAVAVSLGSTI